MSTFDFVWDDSKILDETPLHECLSYLGLMRSDDITGFQTVDQDLRDTVVHALIRIACRLHNPCIAQYLLKCTRFSSHSYQEETVRDLCAHSTIFTTVGEDFVKGLITDDIDFLYDSAFGLASRGAFRKAEQLCEFARAVHDSKECRCLCHEPGRLQLLHCAKCSEYQFTLTEDETNSVTQDFANSILLGTYASDNRIYIERAHELYGALTPPVHIEGIAKMLLRTSSTRSFDATAGILSNPLHQIIGVCRDLRLPVPTLSAETVNTIVNANPMRCLTIAAESGDIVVYKTVLEMICKQQTLQLLYSDFVQFIRSGATDCLCATLPFAGNFCDVQLLAPALLTAWLKQDPSTCLCDRVLLKKTWNTFTEMCCLVIDILQQTESEDKQIVEWCCRHGAIENPLIRQQLLNLPSSTNASLLLFYKWIQLFYWSLDSDIIYRCLEGLNVPGSAFGYFLNRKAKWRKVVLDEIQRYIKIKSLASVLMGFLL